MYWGRSETSVREQALALAARKFTEVLRAGVPLSEAVNMIASETTDRRLRRVLTACAQGFAVGYSFSQTLSHHRSIPEIFTETVRLGEENGRLTDSFAALSAYYEDKDRVRKRIRAAMWYPAFLGVLAAVVVWIVASRLMPVITSVLAATGVGLPTPTRILLAALRLISAWWPCIVAAFVAAAALYRLLLRTRRGALLAAGCRLRMPMIGSVARLTAAGQFANILALLLPTGLSLIETLRIAGRVMENRAAGERIAHAAARLESGDAFSHVICGIEYFPRMICEMAVIGETTGTLAAAMKTAGAYCTAEAAAKSERVLSLLEPVLIAAMGLLVAFIVISVFAAIFSMYNAIGLMT